MQVRVFIKPDQVALMLSAGDWLSDSVFVGVCVCVCTAAEFLLHSAIDM